MGMISEPNLDECLSDDGIHLPEFMSFRSPRGTWGQRDIESVYSKEETKHHDNALNIFSSYAKSSSANLQKRSLIRA